MSAYVYQHYFDLSNQIIIGIPNKETKKRFEFSRFARSGTQAVLSPFGKPAKPLE
jgi:hypothetical protein